MQRKKKNAYDRQRHHMMVIGALLLLIFLSLTLSKTVAFADIVSSEEASTGETSYNEVFHSTLSSDRASIDENSLEENTSYALSAAKTLIDMLPTIAAGVGVLMGCGYIRSLREKTNSAIFTYWSQISIRLIQIKKSLESDLGIINNLYNATARQVWEGSPPSIDKIEIFFKLVFETMQFLKEAPDQMPAYIGWYKDYNTIVSFLSDVIQYDIRNADKYFVVLQTSAQDDRNNRYKSVMAALDSILNNISQRQNIAERKIYPYAYIICRLKKRS